MRKEYEAKGVGFLALSLEPDKAEVSRAAKQLGLRFEVAISGGGEMLGPLGVRNVPSTVFVNEKGIIVGAVTGDRDRAFFKRRAEELLKDKGG